MGSENFVMSVMSYSTFVFFKPSASRYAVDFINRRFLDSRPRLAFDFRISVVRCFISRLVIVFWSLFSARLVLSMRMSTWFSLGPSYRGGCLRTIL